MGIVVGILWVRSIQIETYPRSGRAGLRNTCESCYVALGQPETIAYICQGCGGESRGARIERYCWRIPDQLGSHISLTVWATGRGCCCTIQQRIVLPTVLPEESRHVTRSAS